MIHLVVGVKAYLIYFLFRRELEVALCESCEKISLFRPELLDSEIVI